MTCMWYLAIIPSCNISNFSKYHSLLRGSCKFWKTLKYHLWHYCQIPQQVMLLPKLTPPLMYKHFTKQLTVFHLPGCRHHSMSHTCRIWHGVTEPLLLSGTAVCGLHNEYCASSPLTKLFHSVPQTLMASSTGPGTENRMINRQTSDGFFKSN